MKKNQYKCTLLTDAVITSFSATEGFKESLDYIPGSKFLGIAATKLYDENQAERTLDLFHNGNVRFGDALPARESEEFLKVPLSWYYEKGKTLSDKIYLHHVSYAEKLPQLKQSRKGYFSPKGSEFISVPQDFSLKSAHDRKNRKSKNSQMFGYFSLKAGSDWLFTVEDLKDKYSDEIKNVLVGKHRIGRSRSAEYGLIEIEFLGEEAKTSARNLTGDVIIYAKSNLCFFDEVNGQYTAQPTVRQLVGTDNADIIWEKSQIRTRNYKTWNRRRNNKDTNRLIIESGSVFYVKLNEAISSEFLESGIGSHLNEGFGKIVINPDFLTFSDYYSLKKTDLPKKKFFAKDKGEKDIVIINSLLRIKESDNLELEIDKEVSNFVATYKKDFIGISKSQWGALRNYGKNLQDYKQFKEMVFHPEYGFLYKGQSENEWRQKNRRVILEDYVTKLQEGNRLPFLIKVSNQMAKSN